MPNFRAVGFWGGAPKQTSISFSTDFFEVLILYSVFCLEKVSGAAEKFLSHIQVVKGPSIRTATYWFTGIL